MCVWMLAWAGADVMAVAINGTSPSASSHCMGQSAESGTDLPKCSVFHVVLLFQSVLIAWDSLLKVGQICQNVLFFK